MKSRRCKALWKRFAPHLLAQCHAIYPYTLAKCLNVGVLSMGYLMLPVSSMHFDASSILMAEARILNLGVFKKT